MGSFRRTTQKVVMTVTWAPLLLFSLTATCQALYYQGGVGDLLNKRGRRGRTFPSRRRGRSSRSLSFQLIMQWKKKLLLSRELATSSALVVLILDSMGGQKS